MKGLLTAAVGLSVALSACNSATPDTRDAALKLQVVATTTLVGDVVNTVATDEVSLTVLLPRGADPHSYDPTPQDVATVADADVVFVNGLGLESFLISLLENAGGEAEVITVSAGVPPRYLADDHAHAGEQGEVDPHVWLDPNNVAIWTQNIESALGNLDPENAGIYAANAAAYRIELEALDSWIREQVTRIPETNRSLVTDHAVFGYFADRYGFEQAGAIFPGFSTLAEPSAQERADLEAAILALNVQAVFVGTTINPSLAQQIAGDTGIQVIPLYTGSLSEPGGPADSYLALMVYNVSAISEALR